MTVQNDIQLLHKHFEKRRKPAPKKRQLKEKKKRLRINQKIQDLHMERIIELREKQGLSYEKIGHILSVRRDTILKAYTRYTVRGYHRDNRADNGRVNPRRKIGPELRLQLLDRDLL